MAKELSVGGAFNKHTVLQRDLARRQVGLEDR
jgi:hypothetical protein